MVRDAGAHFAKEFCNLRITDLTRPDANGIDLLGKPKTAIPRHRGSLHGKDELICGADKPLCVSNRKPHQRLLMRLHVFSSLLPAERGIMRIVFFGTADFGIPSLDAMQQAGHSIVAAVTLPPAPRGRGRVLEPSPVEHYARQKGLTPLFVLRQLSDPAFCERLVALQADAFVVIAFRLLPECVFAIPPLGTLNVHASLLPRYRGPAPIQRAIEAGESETGVTIFRIDAGIDTGLILAQRATPIGSEETSLQLSHRLSVIGAELLVQTLDELQEGRITLVAQDGASATPAPKLKKDESRIDWRLPASTIFNRIRAFKPFPGVSTRFAGKMLGIEWALPLQQQLSCAPGIVYDVTPEGFVVACGNGALKVLSVKPEGKRSMSAADFSRGYHLKRGMTLE